MDEGYSISAQCDANLRKTESIGAQIVAEFVDAGVMLASATKNIDETHSEMLLHGIMSTIAEFYARTSPPRSSST